MQLETRLFTGSFDGERFTETDSKAETWHGVHLDLTFIQSFDCSYAAASFFRSVVGFYSYRTVGDSHSGVQPRASWTS